MTFDLWAFLIENIEAAGAIGGYVAISIIGIALLTNASRGKLNGEKPIGPVWAQPIIGGLLGVIPGCGGTIVASSLYKNKNLTFGGLFAAFITTLGEGSFVLLGASAEASVTANLSAFIIVNAVGLVVGISIGYAIDALGISINSATIPTETKPREREHAEGVMTLTHRFIETYGFYLILLMSMILIPSSVMALWGGGIDALDKLSVVVAMTLTIFSIVYYVVYKYTYKGIGCAKKDGVMSTLRHAVYDIAFVVTYVFIGLFVANYIIDVLVGPDAFESWMTSSAIVVVVIAALIGATPGCGGMIAVAVAFTTIDQFPIAALIASAIATSGDGIFPLLASNKKDALVITVASTVIAIVVGYLVLALGI
ncbi:putative manganese transporter [Exiguobacterium qingdaonense]|uniref:putative manganese transporter n=1 Tax=Exiguobacterium qingdaonense TaxID=2751251 RepID=UPI001BE79DA0|nr:putative manganese transporter [Exiguobacterium qingdaonense]